MTAGIPVARSQQVLTDRNRGVVRVEGPLRFAGDTLGPESREIALDASGTFPVERGEVRRATDTRLRQREAGGE